VRVTLVYYQKADFPEIFWLKRLLPGSSVEQIEDLSQSKAFPDSIVICKRLGQLRQDLLRLILRTPGVVLFHISDEWYLDRLEPYLCFVHVIRNYHHSALRQEGITQIPMGPSRCQNGTHQMRPVADRRYIWAFAGSLSSTRRSLVRQLSRVGPNFVHVTGSRDQSATWLDPEEYLGVLGDSIFVPCPMGNANLESFRLYEALDCGAIPIVERRPWLDYFTQLFGPHPLLSVRDWSEACRTMDALRSDPATLRNKQIEIRDWWRQLESRTSRQVASILASAAGRKTRMTFVPRVPSRLRGFREMLKHHNGAALWARSRLTIRRLCRLRA
jgi:hypothetical protein